jgi:protein ImuB
VRERDPDAEREALRRIAAWAGQFTPMVAIESQGIVLEVETSLRLFRGHARLTTAIQRGIRDLGFSAAAGVAPTPLAARLFARAEAQGRAGRSCLTLDELAERAAELPLFLLDWPGETLARLTDLGILRLRDVLALPAAGLAKRFGPELALSLDRLMGRVSDPREPYSPPPRFRSRLELPAEADGVEALLFPLRRLLVELEGHARGRGAGVQQLTLWLGHGRKARTRLELEFASPEREADFILAIAREKLGRLVLPAATHALELRADALLPYVPRTAAWLPGSEDQKVDAERLIERLSARIGSDRVFRIALANDHRPEKDWKSCHSREGGNPARANAATFHRGPRPTWLLPHPHRLITEDGVPRLQGALEITAGPERIESGWWDGEEVRRDYYVASNARGETYWIYREHRDLSAWYLHGVFA